MKALVYTGVQEMTYREAPDPVAAPGEELVRVTAVGICGSDMHGYHGHDPRRPAPLILGHEAAGTITGGARDGERVTLNPLVVHASSPHAQAGRENICANRELISMPPREGAFADYVAIPAENLVTVPDHVPLDKAALAEPLSVSWHAATLALGALHPSMARKVLVIGGGAIGLTSALCLRAMGCEDITIAEPHDARRAFLAEQCGETAVASAEGHYPLVIDAVGYKVTREIASARVERGGVIVHIGLGEDLGGLDIRRFTLEEITFIGSYCYTKEDFRETAQAIFDGRLGPLDWFERRPLSAGAQAFRDLHEHRVANPKIVLEPAG